ncbi:uncharacterized protein METZ01_LOCUS256127 [marine metagenome]|uniref:DUF3108 domain-containing protein n=1 Tax=marine metagenome TaxID=408172 RepID=A0A382IWI9_9ZZZZ
MRKYILIIITLLFASKAFSHTSHYDGLKKIEMDVVLNGEVIGYSNYFFEKNNKIMTVKNYTKFKVKLLGVTVFSISSEATEKYENDKLIYFKSNTFQNDKEKFVNLNYNKSSKKFIIDGSSYQGEASLDCIIGNWWNHKIFKASKQISPLSGSVKEQVVTFIGKEKININNKEYLTEHFKLKSKDENLPDEKKLNFDIWYNPESNLIIKVSYSKMGNWEYRLKNFE